MAPSEFVPIPAVDIRGGRCVRLRQGDFSRETVYGSEPAEAALRWQRAGAKRLHVVDLDGARTGTRENEGVISELLGSVTVPVQVGGGIRDLDSARHLLRLGAEWVVVGTVLVEDPASAHDWLEALGADHLIVAVDARDGFVVTHGWGNRSGLPAEALCGSLGAAGVRRVLYTDVSRDGMLDGPNVPATARLVELGGPAVLASGGVATIEHVRALVKIGAEGAIIGKALYDGQLSLEAILDDLAAATPAPATTPPRC